MSGALERLHGLDSDLSGVTALVAGLGVSGFAAADALLERGARVRVVDDRAPAEGTPAAERAHLLDVFGAELVVGGDPDPDALVRTDRGAVDLVVASPGWRPTHPVLRAADGTGAAVWGEVELAWRLQGGDAGPPWLTVTGTNGKTTTVELLGAVLTAAGLRARTAGNIGTPLVDAVRDPAGADVLAVELSSFQLHLVRTVSPHAATCLNLAPDHLDWHGGPDAYRDAKARVYERTKVAAVFNVADPATEAMVREADVVEGCRAVGVGPGAPRVGEVGVVEGLLVDRAFIEERAHAAVELGALDDLVGLAGVADPAQVPAHVVANALAAAALARSLGVPATAVRDGLRAASLPPHRAATVATAGGVRWVDDSKATNPHAADASLAALDDVVWVAGGLAKGATYDDLVARHAARLRAVVLVGADRELVAQALGRHAPDVPVVRVDPPDTAGVAAPDDERARALMDRVVAAAAGLARPGSTVLLAPAAASMDQFTSYVARGEAFAAAVLRLTGPGQRP
ncbi:UDP-N-acetylmuramoyl-L-alanine--D-glutamate ligase [Aquipuribacter nitratireducens]|uniref:UDP-N-acetylmuramoylalanine--D-glutamate ligase n=1 Tax=Aquipuribacter nitratireducens TaxID=650104 RepID=A0ABW0GRF3_9MICO